MTGLPKPLAPDEIAAVKRVAETRGDILGQRLITTIEQRDKQFEKLRETCIPDLRQNWGAFAAADLVPAGFIERMEAAGFAELVPVSAEALVEPFAAELGIEPGGMMWQLTQQGHRALAAPEPKP